MHKRYAAVMRDVPKRSPLFDRDALARAMADVWRAPQTAHEGADAPALTRRRLLQLGTSASVSGVLPAPMLGAPVVALAETLPMNVPAAELAHAVESYMHRFVLSGNYVTNIYHAGQKNQSGGITGRFSDLQWRILDPTYREFARNPEQDALVPAAQNAQQAVAEIQKLISMSIESNQRRMEINRFLIAYPQAKDVLAHAIKNHPDFKLPQGIKDVATHLSDQMSRFPTMQSVDGSVACNSESFTESCNGMLYRRFGVMLPDTTEAQATHIKSKITEGLSDIWGDEVHSSVHVRAFSVDVGSDGRAQPSYLITQDYEPDNTPEENSAEFHALIASIASVYPTEIMLVSDDQNLATSVPKGTLSL